ncbi:nicotinamidase-like amidase [Xenococcus sp. PCC 7305]|uniref:cysteine hydrolase family protein n=1 Tax=Xenococcus sp. PCC 7305 TaxID=102125 RepID=UPI0002ABE0CA|nr:isochorismatase family cysteine hydrolase [Xenococcus sp. PCC 7305]ELS04626.1 nicotinamidase-like amidase [Xenococcus sp. PCC 7305]
MNRQTALIIIDMQNDFVLAGAPMEVAGARAIVPNLKKVLNYFRRASWPVFHVIREYRADGSDIEKPRRDRFLTDQSYCVPGTKGWEIIEELNPVAGEYRLVKNHFSGFMNTELDFMLRRLEVSNIVVCGVQYPNCIRATIYDGVSLGYDVTLVTDAAGAETEAVAKANIYDISNIGVECITTEQFLLARP